MNTITLASLNAVDWLLVAILAYSTIRAFLRGIVLELFSLGGLIAGILIASWNYQRLAPPLQRLLRPIFNAAISIWNIVAFLLIVLGIMLIAYLAARLIRGTAHTIGLGFFDRLLGALFGIVRGCLLGVALLMAATAFLPQSTWVENSRLTPYFLAGVHAVSFVVPRGLQQKLLNGIAQLKHSGPDWIKLPR
ncbi:CvpA family protein [Granulicella sp. dw_53]|uniref:CvpA family protein n=1 Tax=Granulicella sp. dw_53 TaxID=2719792 RepID=UPI001BD2ADD8|nr:CvpA family protein [Granulicella sp. dw_53]